MWARGVAVQQAWHRHWADAVALLVIGGALLAVRYLMAPYPRFFVEQGTCPLLRAVCCVLCVW